MHCTLTRGVCVCVCVCWWLGVCAHVSRRSLLCSCNLLLARGTLACGTPCRASLVGLLRLLHLCRQPVSRFPTGCASGVFLFTGYRPCARSHCAHLPQR